MNRPLHSLAGFLAAHPTLNWLPSSEHSAIAAQSAHVRWRLVRELSDAGAGFGYSRVEQLALEGIAANDSDSREFAQGVVDAMADHLTPRNLKHLAEAFAAAHARETGAGVQDAIPTAPEAVLVGCSATGTSFER